MRALLLKHIRLVAAALFVCLIAGAGAATAQDIRIQGIAPQKTAPPYVPGAELVVATRLIPPFVMDKGAKGQGVTSQSATSQSAVGKAAGTGELEGFSVELWQAIANETGLKSRFQVYPTLPALLDSVRTGANPVGIAAISVTSDRALVMDFSQPMFRSGLSILVPAGGRPGLAVFASFITSDVLAALAVFFALLLIPAHLFWFMQRGRKEGEWLVPKSYGRGMAETLYWSAEAMIGQASAAPKSWYGRFLAFVWKAAGVLLIAYFTALIATTLTVSSLRGGIEGPADLIGKRVATISGSTSARYLRELKADPLEFDNFDQAVEYMLKGQAIATVYDTPMILFYARHAGNGRVKVAGSPFRTEDYGIVFPAGSDLRPVVNAGLLKTIENGTYQAIYDKWFGSDNSR
jgi:polar amino acid transport system substrate-binding protein